MGDHPPEMRTKSHSSDPPWFHVSSLSVAISRRDTLLAPFAFRAAVDFLTSTPNSFAALDSSEGKVARASSKLTDAPALARANETS